MYGAWVTTILTVAGLSGLFGYFILDRRPRSIPKHLGLSPVGLEDDPPDIVRRHYRIKMGDDSVRFMFRGTQRHALPTAYNLNQTGLMLTNIDHNKSLARMQEEHADRIETVEWADHDDEEDKARRLQVDTNRHNRIYAKRKSKHDKEMDKLTKDTIKAHDKSQKASRKRKKIKKKMY